MCAYSVMSNDMQKYSWEQLTGGTYSSPLQDLGIGVASQNGPLYAQAQKDPEVAKMLLEVLAKLDALDKKVGLVSCEVDDTVRAKYIALLERVANAVQV